MKEIELTNEIKKILSANPERKTRYSKDLEWFKKWQSLWEKDLIRVGVIGITSSGKSTLINALLGDDLLSVAVRPSSSQLVSCSYAREQSVTIYFKNGEKKKINDSDKLKESIKQYSDESYNTKNEKKVAQLELSTPNFDLGEDVLLIDSPGLDASGYEAHEKLTLETLLPTVDIVIFVTTVKSEIDRKMKLTLDTIGKHNCPVLIVQNMLDSVCPSADGKKSAATVAEERLKRVIQAVDQSSIKNKKDVKITQLSAINALRYRCHPYPTEAEKEKYTASRYEQFVIGVKELVKIKRPEIEKQRLRTIQEYIETLIQQENQRLKNIPDEKPTSINLTSISDNINSALNTTYNNINSIIGQLKEIHSKYSSQDKKSLLSSFLSFFTQNDFNSTLEEKKIIEIRNTINKFETNITKYVHDFSEICSATIKCLNLPNRDLWSYNGLPRSMPDISIRKKTITKTKIVDKDGILNSFIRHIDFFDNGWGTETISYTETTIDIEATQKSIKNYLERLIFEYGKTLETWVSNAESTVESIQHEIELRITSIKEKERLILDANDWKQIRKDLLLYLSQYSEKMKTDDKLYNNNVHLPEKLQDNTKLLNVPDKMRKIHTAAEEFLFSIQQSSFNYAIRKKQREKYSSVIISNSQHSLSEFLYRFYRINKSNLEEKNIYHISDDLLVLSTPTASHIESICSEKSGRNFFLLTNGLHLHTNFETDLFQKLQKNLIPDDALFIVIQDFEELANGNAISESLRAVQMKQNETQNGNKGLTLICHRNPIYNMAVIHAQLTDINLQEETTFYKTLTSNFPLLAKEDAKKRINNILRSITHKK